MTETKPTLTQFAEHVGVKRRKLWKWIAAGYIKPTFMEKGEWAFSAENAAVAHCFAHLKRKLALSPATASRYAGKIKGAKHGDKLVIANRDVAKALGIDTHNNRDPKTGGYVDIIPMNRILTALCSGEWPGISLIDISGLRYKAAREGDEEDDNEDNEDNNEDNNDENNDNVD